MLAENTERMVENRGSGVSGRSKRNKVTGTTWESSNGRERRWSEVSDRPSPGGGSHQKRHDEIVLFCFFFKWVVLFGVLCVGTLTVERKT